MNKTIMIIGVFTSILFSTEKGMSQDWSKNAMKAMQKKNYQLAVDYGHRAWNQKKSAFNAYLIAYGEYNLRHYKDAAYYAGIALYDDTYKQIGLNDFKREQLKVFIRVYKNKSGKKEKNIVNELYANYPRKKTIYLNFTLNKREERTMDMENLAAMKELEKEKLNSEEYYDNLRKQGIHDTIISQVERMVFWNNMLEQTVRKGHTISSSEWVNHQIIEQTGGYDDYRNNSYCYYIEWIDSTIRVTSVDSYGYSIDYKYEEFELDSYNPYLHYAFYNITRYPELFENKIFLYRDMAKLYYTYLIDGIDPNNKLIQEYKLSGKNIQVFYSTVFPEIPRKPTVLQKFLIENPF